MQLLAPTSGPAHDAVRPRERSLVAPRVIGVTGPPGAGKSTLINQLVRQERAAERRVAVLAVDPTSPFSGGALLGDRIRMDLHSTDDGVFIRSMATRGHHGGLSAAAFETVTLLRAAGFDTTIVETVGVGQSEVGILSLSDVVLLVLIPGSGDDIQAIKAGVMEIADVYVLNKADRPGIDALERAVRGALGETYLFAADRAHHTVPTDEPGEAPARTGARRESAGVPLTSPVPAIVRTVATDGSGLEDLVTAVERYLAHSLETGALAERRERRFAAAAEDVAVVEIKRWVRERHESGAIQPSELRTALRNALDTIRRHE